MDPRLKKLQAKWYRKLKESGFEDIEDTESPKEFLKEWHSTWFKTHSTPESFKERHRCYQQRTYFATSHTFSSELEERVWCLYSDGFSYREIAKMTRTKENKSNKDKVKDIIDRLTKVMRGY